MARFYPLLGAIGGAIPALAILVRDRDIVLEMLQLNAPLFAQVAIGAIALPLCVFAAVCLKERFLGQAEQ